jgi:predicted enzyme related to lactoylglutathione lyase
MGNRFCHLGLATKDLDAAKDFYSKVFDWKLSDAPVMGMPYTLIDTGREPGGGMMVLPDPQVPPSWAMYVEVDDVPGTCEKIKQLGGRIFKEPEDVPGMGSFAIVSDPQGAVFGIWADSEA